MGNNAFTMTTFGDRLKQRAAQLEISDAEVSRRAGLSPRRYSNYTTDNREPDLKTLVTLVRALDTSADALLGLRDWDGLPSIPAEEVAEDFARVSEVDVHASAGGGAVVLRDKDGGASWGFPEPWIRAEVNASPMDLRIVTIEGDSGISDPPKPDDLQPGDKVVVNLGDTRPSPPGKFIVDDGMALVAKQVEYIPGSDPPTIRLTSRNDRYAPYERTLDEARIVGRIVGRWQRL
jgi:transcriptional regulator with XRE-family HTH domain